MTVGDIYVSTPKVYEEISGWTPCPAPNEAPIEMEVLEELSDSLLLVRRVGENWLPIKVQCKYAKQHWKLKEDDSEVNASDG